MLTHIPRDLLYEALDTIGPSIKEIKELIEMLHTENNILLKIIYSNSKASMCLENLEITSCRILATPFKELPLWIGQKDGLDLESQKVLEWRFKKGV